MSDYYDGLEDQVIELEAELEQVKNEAYDLEEENKLLRENSVNQRDEIQKLQVRLLKLFDDYYETRDRYQDVIGFNETISQELEELQELSYNYDESKFWRKQCLKFEERINELDAEIEELREELDVCNERNEELREYTNPLGNEEIIKLQEEIQRHRERREEAAKAYAESKDELESRIDNQRSSIRFYQGEIKKRDKEIEVLQKKIEGRDMTAENQADYITHLQNKMKEYEND